MKKITLLMALVFSSGLMFGQVLSEDFEGGLSLPAGWTINDIAGGGDVWTFATGGEAVGFTPPNTIYYDNGLFGNYALFDSDGIGNNGVAENAALESPVFNVSAASIVILDFNHGFTTGYGGQAFVEVYNGTTWVQVDSYSAASDFGAVQIDVSTELAGVSNAQVRFRWVGDWSWGWAVDNVVVSAPTCADPNTFVVGPNGVTSTSFDIAWTDPNGGGTVFDIEWGVQGFLPGLGTMVNDLAATNYDFTGLTPDTAYEFYITANCTGGNGDSNEIGPISFLSGFDCTTYTVPFMEVFDNSNAFASCYTTEDVDGDTLSWISQQDLDLDGDTVNETFATNANGDVATTPMKNDWLIGPAISLTAGTNYEVTTKFNVFGGTPNASLEAFILDAPNSGATQVATLFSNTGIVTQGAFETLETMAYEEINTFSVGMSGDYYIAYRSFGAGGSGFVLMFDSNIQESLSIDEFDQNTFTHNYNKDLETLTLESSTLTMTNIEIYSILGQNVISKPLSSTREVIDVASLNDGIYLAKVFADGGSKTIKFVKN
ncbi:T9SS type A sorting domain-containing protein [Winogradskyella sp. HB-48]|uniref:T9SS type A sorting domain-containing protein n=1 Tax=Winogradskyella sp. HB-48 TaxID=3416808 RepID=UPI003CF6634B